MTSPTVLTILPSLFGFIIEQERHTYGSITKKPGPMILPGTTSPLDVDHLVP
jgi:hypothetical protein